MKQSVINNKVIELNFLLTYFTLIDRLLLVELSQNLILQQVENRFTARLIFAPPFFNTNFFKTSYVPISYLWRIACIKYW